MTTTRKPAVKRGPASDDDFTFPSSKGDVTVPSLAKAPKPNAWTLMQIEAIENPRVAQARMNMAMLESAVPEAALAIIKQFDTEEFGEFMVEWGEHSGVSMGKS
jgi:hypothetical protein